jgi:hypothetical protein
MAKRYSCDILSNASLKSRDMMHKGFRVTSAKATASPTVASASNIYSLVVHNIDLDAAVPLVWV